MAAHKGISLTKISRRVRSSVLGLISADQTSVIDPIVGLGLFDRIQHLALSSLPSPNPKLNSKLSLKFVTELTES